MEGPTGPPGLRVSLSYYHVRVSLISLVIFAASCMCLCIFRVQLESEETGAIREIQDTR